MVVLSCIEVVVGVLTKIQSPKNMGNLGTGFLRMVSKSEEGLTRILHINVTKTGGKGDYMSQDDYLRFSSYEATSTFMRLSQI